MKRVGFVFEVLIDPALASPDEWVDDVLPARWGQAIVRDGVVIPVPNGGWDEALEVTYWQSKFRELLLDECGVTGALDLARMRRVPDDELDTMGVQFDVEEHADGTFTITADEEPDPRTTNAGDDDAT